MAFRSAGQPLRRSAGPIAIEGDLIASPAADATGYAKGDRLRHEEFGEGTAVR